MAITKEQLIEELNQDLQLEYSAAIQYIQHSSIIDGLHAAFIEELKTHADEEIGHAKTLSDRIDYLGGTPSMQVGKRKGSKDAVEMLQQDLEGEQTAIQRYRERISQAEELGDYGTKQVIMEILVDEEEHENDLKTFLGI